MRILTRKGQATAEQAIVMGLAVLAVSGIGVFVTRKIMAMIFATSNHASDGLVDYQGATLTDVPQQYVPYYDKRDYNTEADRTFNEQRKEGGEIKRTLTKEEQKRLQGGYSETGTDTTQDDNWTNTGGGGGPGGSGPIGP